MKLRVFGMLATISAVAIGLSAEPAAAQGKGKAAKEKKAEEPEPTGPAKMKGKLGLSPKGLGWNVTLEALAKVYDKVFDDEFMPLYKKAQPGPAMDALDAEVADKKQLLRRNKILFGDLPTGVDYSALKGEYTYGNKESMTKLTLRTGVTRNFFFFDDKLWKVYDEHKLRKGGPYGETWEEATELLTKKFGAKPYKLEPDFPKGRNFEELLWTDGTTVIRAINRAPIIGLVYQDAIIFANLPKHRPNKPKNPHAIDKDVAAATAKPPPEEKKPPEEKNKGKKVENKPKGKGK
ncbi:MAG: hypothetical protein HS104_14025 [Polyangiaceae bacterium]|nr:hypothetical protein [Polyangiaceae bacterium]MCE7893200.1 hypothetical protein [Sorangiineae bacterium PRO1]MCL4748970.1 hypothetical protein [Myxococcales bacterium]